MYDCVWSVREGAERARRRVRREFADGPFMMLWVVCAAWYVVCGVRCAVVSGGERRAVSDVQ